MALILLVSLAMTALPRKTSGQAKPTSSETRQSSPQASFGGDPEEVEESEVLRIRTSLVTLPVAAMDSNGRYIPDLRREDFQVFEDGIEQEIAFFADAERPLSIVLLIDTSVSVSSSWKSIGKAVEDFINQLRPKDTVLPIAFDSTIRTPLTRSTNDHALLLATIREMLSEPSEGNGATRLFDAIEFVNKRVLPTAKGTRMAVLVFSDGVDSGSRTATGKGTLNDVAEVGALYYTLRFNTKRGSVTEDLKFRTLQNVAIAGGAEYLRALAEKTGGRSIGVQSRYPDLTRQTFATVAEELRHLYSLSYYPKNKVASKKRRQIKVSVGRQGVKVQTRKSYIYETPDE